MNYPHISVMLHEFLEFFKGKVLKTFVEGTVGAGGHAQAILEAHPEIEHYIGFDQDPEALEIAQRRLSKWGHKLELIQKNFDSLGTTLSQKGISQVDGFFLIWGSPLCN